MRRPRADDFTLVRPVLVGLANPYSADPLDALSVDPPRGTGARLWRMSGLTLDEYTYGFAKVNVDDRITFSAFLESVTGGTTAAVFGREAARALRLPTNVPFFAKSVRTGGSTWYLLPHPGGLCRVYNDADARAKLRVIMNRLFWLGKSRNEY